MKANLKTTFDRYGKYVTGHIEDAEMYQKIKAGTADWKDSVKSRITHIRVPKAVFERLLKLDRKGGEGLIEFLRNAPKTDIVYGNIKLDKPVQTLQTIADYLLQNGVIVPPCKVGQIVYVVRSQTSNGKNLYLRQERIDHYRIFGDRSFMCFESGRISVSSDNWSTTVFLTREEAEKALKGDEGYEQEDPFR